MRIRVKVCGQNSHGTSHHLSKTNINPSSYNPKVYSHSPRDIKDFFVIEFENDDIDFHCAFLYEVNFESQWTFKRKLLRFSKSQGHYPNCRGHLFRAYFSIGLWFG